MREFIVLLFLLCAVASGSAQQYLKGNSPYRYVIGTTEPPVNWKDLDFDDSSWLTDTIALGYGYKEIVRPIDKTAHTLYLRYNFKAEKPLAKTASLAPLFDDGFIVYLNGAEVLRYNMGAKSDVVTSKTLASRSHHQSANWWDWEAYYLDSTLFGKNIKEGDNVLSVEVHNDSLLGGDLLFALQSLVNMDDPFGNLYNLENRAHRHVELDSSEFPILRIETDEHGICREAKDVKARLSVIEADGYVKPSMSPKVEIDIKTEVHGQSSADFAKRSYEIELKDANGNDTSIALLGMPADEDWILYAPYNDKSLVRNDVIFELGRRLGHYEPRTRKCELILNGEYRGLYILTERIKRGKNRVDVAKLDSTDVSGVKLTGGYVVKYDKGGSGLQYVSPKSDKMLPIQKEYISTFYANLDRVRRTPMVTDSAEGYLHYINPASLIDYLCVNEFVRNSDAYNTSSYMYKDRDDKDGRIHFGPLWDGDLSFGASYFQWGEKIDGWQFSINTYMAIGRYMADTNFKKAFIARWQGLRNKTFSRDSIYKLIDDKIAELKTAKDRNYYVWPLRRIGYFGTNNTYLYDEEIAAMKAWIVKRGVWIDENASKISYKLPTDFAEKKGNPQSLFVYPTQISDRFTLLGSLKEGGRVQAQLLSAQGTVMQTVYDGEAISKDISLDCQLQSNVSSGIYFISVWENGRVSATIPCYIK